MGLPTPQTAPTHHQQDSALGGDRGLDMVYFAPQ